MAKKKGIQIDVKELGLKYGDRVGLGVAAFLALLFIVWGFSSIVSAPLKADDITLAKQNAQAHMQRWPVKEEALEPANTDKAIKSVKDIALLSESKKKPIPVGTLTTRLPWDYHPPKDDVSRSNPEVFAVAASVGRPVDMAYKLTDTDGKQVLTAVPRDGDVKGPAKDNNKDRLKGSGGGSAPKPPPMGGPGKGKGNNPPTPPASGGGGGAPEKRWTGQMKAIAQVGDKDILAVNIWPTRAAYVVGLYPYGKQIDALTRSLKLDKSQLKSYFNELEVQRREIVLKGTRLPDGSVAAQDLVLVPDPAKSGAWTLKPYAETPSSPPADRPEEALAAGWAPLDKDLQVAMTKWSTESWDEPDGVLKSLIALSGRLSPKIPKPLRGEYPGVADDLPELKELLEKVKKENTPIVPPKIDPRLDKDNDNRFDDGQPKQGGGAGGSAGGGGAGAMGAPPASGSGAGAMQPPKGGAGAGGDKKPTEAVSLAFVPDWCVVRFLDLTLADDKRPVGGRTFEYRFRVIMKNPNFGEKNVTIPEFAKIEFLSGPWSKPVRVAFPAGHAVYADERQRLRAVGPDLLDLDKVPVQVHKWVGFFDPEAGQARDPERMGEWWVDRILAARGEHIGRVPTDRKQGQASLVVWVPYQPEGNDVNKMGSEAVEKFHTPSLMTDALLVDFEGGARTIGTRFKRVNGKGEDEDVPAELLIVEADGRLVARSLLKDKEDEARKKRHDRWSKWIEEVKKKKADEAKDEKKDEKKDKKPSPSQ